MTIRGVPGVFLATSVRVEPAVADPALLVIFGHAAVDQRRHPVEIAVAPRPGQRLDADILVIAGIVALVELVAGRLLGSRWPGWPQADDIAGCV